VRSFAHVAGALGKPVWILNRFDTCWRWLLGREDSPWYPGLRQFRRGAREDWTSVMQRVAAALSDAPPGRPPGTRRTWKFFRQARFWPKLATARSSPGRDWGV
jgi:hypothetical protein